MALKMDVPVEASLIGVEIPGCYLRIVGGSFDKDTITFDVAGYMTRDAREAGAREVAFYRMQVAMGDAEGGGLLPYLYSQMKRSDLFSTAKDC